MEELFTAQNVEESNKFLTALYGHALWVLATIRSDHLHFCHRHPEMLSVLKGSGHYPLGPDEPFMMSDMIVKPAIFSGLTISDTLARRIVNDTLAFAIWTVRILIPLTFHCSPLSSINSLKNAPTADSAVKYIRQLAASRVPSPEHVKTVEKELRQFEGAKTSDHLAKIFCAGERQKRRIAAHSNVRYSSISH